jgi:phosphoribosylglycinamide formyltransferase 1
VTLALGVLASGRGSNLQAILEACARPGFPARVAVVVSDRERAVALQRARAAGVEALWVNPKDFGDREAFDLALVRELRTRDVGLVCTAGFMRILSAAFVRAFAGRILNIHPSLLPAFPGLHPHERVLAAGVKITGCTVHVVRPEMDDGPILAQAAVPVRDGDTAESLAARVLEAEHQLYPHALALFASGRVQIAGEKVVGPQVSINQEKALFCPPLG